MTENEMLRLLARGALYTEKYINEDFQAICDEHNKEYIQDNYRFYCPECEEAHLKTNPLIVPFKR